MNSLGGGDPPGSEASFPGSRSFALAVTFTLSRTYIRVSFEKEYRVVCESAGRKFWVILTMLASINQEYSWLNGRLHGMFMNRSKHDQSPHRRDAACRHIIDNVFLQGVISKNCPLGIGSIRLTQGVDRVQVDQTDA